MLYLERCCMAVARMRSRSAWSTGSSTCGMSGSSRGTAPRPARTPCLDFLFTTLSYREKDVASGAGGARKPQCTLIYVYFVVFHIFVCMVCHLRHYPTKSGQIRGFGSGAPPEYCAISVPLCATSNVYHRVLNPFQNRRPPEPLKGVKPRRFHSSPMRLLLIG